MKKEILNDKYVYVEWKGNQWRLYDERFTDSYTALYSEMQLKLLKLIEDYNFKIFYVSCSPKTNLKVELKDGCINLEGADINIIKENQCSDFYYLYENRLCEVVFSFCKVSSGGFYYYDFLLVVNQSFSLNSFFNYNFKIINIESIKEVNKSDISFEYIQKIFESRILIDNNCAPIYDKDFYDLSDLDYGYDNFVRDFKGGSKDFDIDEYINFNSLYFDKNFDHKRYIKSVFKLLCTHIWATDRTYYKQKNGPGTLILYKEKYDLGSGFLTNFGSLVGMSSISIVNGERVIESEDYYPCSLHDSTAEQGIFISNFYIEPFFGEVDFDNLPIEKRKYYKPS